VTDVSPASGNRIVCYCDDCQAFARYLGRTDVMNAAGGTDLFQVAPARVRITDGADALRCVRLSEKGLFRWYADCCKTPVGNTLPRVPFVGLVGPIMDHEGDGRSRDEVLGPPLGAIHGRYAKGGLPAGAHAKVSLGIIARCGRVFAGWAVAGLGQPSPFFERGTRAPRFEPHVLTTAEREAAYSMSST
jgi:hypothetical protein